MIEGASELAGSAPDRSLNIVGMICDNRRLTFFEARLHDALGVPRCVFVTVFVADVHLDSSDPSCEPRERMLGPLVDALLEALGSVDVFVGANFDVHNKKLAAMRASSRSLCTKWKEYFGPGSGSV